MIETAIYSLIGGSQSVTALVANHIYPLILPTEATYPAITYQIVSGTAGQTLAGRSIERIRLQIDCWAKDYIDAVSLRHAVISSLADYQGPLSDGSQCLNCKYLQSIDFYSSGDELFRAGCEFYLFVPPVSF